MKCIYLIIRGKTVSYNSLFCEHANQMLIICFNIYKYCILKEIPIYVCAIRQTKYRIFPEANVKNNLNDCMSK